MKPLPAQYDHKISEKSWQEYWEAEGTHHWDETATREESYVIDTPPPTVSGLLHMGHIYSYTQADFIARYQRMAGKSVFYPMGFDDNGLPTERLVEKVKKIRATELPREEFIKVCQDVVQEAEEQFRELFRSTALSVDWRQEYQTISEHTRRLSQMSFLDLFGKNHVYRQLQPTLWDPIDRTALAQADVEDKELPGAMHELTFFVNELKRPNGMREEVLIATTRPELLPACVAVMFHPDDERYKRLTGTTAVTPLFGVKVPFIADDKVNPEKGTGLVMCCTFGDQTDVDWWKKHKLPVRVILDKAGRICNLEGLGASPEWPSIQAKPRLEAFAGKLTGMKVKEAREAIVDILKAYECISSITPLTHSVKCAERSGAPLEILVTPQWFVRVLDKKEALLESANKCVWHPEFMKLRVEQWINGLSWDWCISRQRYFGVPFPAWYSKRKGEEGKVLLAHPDDLPVNPLVDLPRGYKKEEVEPDMDVMDTWATSSISPQISSHAITKDLGTDYARHQKLFPADLRPQAHEIIRTWAFYTLVKALLHENTAPWKNLMISGWCLASDKTKMSKSKGNVVTPVELIQEKGTDAVRYWASTSRLGMDTAFSEDLLKIGRKLVNKLWNASSFAGQHLVKLEGATSTAAEDVKAGRISEPLDIWVLTRLHRAIATATESFAAYEYCDARVAVEDFFWNDFCDNYLELAKTRSYGENCTPAQQQSAIRTLHYCLNGILRLFAPFVPHITEELYSYLFDADFAKLGSIHARGNWPKATDYPLDEAAERTGILTVSALNVVRKFKSEQKISIKTPLAETYVFVADAPAGLKEALPDLQNAISASGVTLATSQPADAIQGDDGQVWVATTLAPNSEAA